MALGQSIKLIKKAIDKIVKQTYIKNVNERKNEMEMINDSNFEQ